MFGPYRLAGLLGRGGMGEVHRAYDTGKNDRLVALKLLPEQLSNDREFRARFRREAEIAALLREPHVIPIHDYGQIDGRLYLDMRLVEGADLATVLHRDEPFSPERAVAVIEQVAAALDAAHGEGLVHRDVKPSNILVTPGPPEFVYLVDFGIARGVRSSAHGRITGTGATVGTLEYMAPERFLDHEIDHRVDVYALGCVLFEALAGRPPYVGDLPMLVRSHLDLPVPALSAHRSALPPPLDDVIAVAMAKDPADRYATAGALAVAARAALTSAPIATPARTAAASEPQRSPVALLTRPGAVAPPPHPTAVGTPPTAFPSQPDPAAPTAIDGAVYPARPAAARRRRTRVVVAAAVLVLALAATVLVVGLQSTPIVERVLDENNTVYALATAELDGRPVILSGTDSKVRVWDLATGASVGQPFNGHTQTVESLATAQLDGRPVVVSGSQDGAVRVWDLATGAPVGLPLRPPVDGTNVFAVATAVLDGRPVALAGGYDPVEIWDMTTGTRIVGPLADPVGALATAQLDGRPVFVSTAGDTVRVWDLATGRPIGQPLVGHSGTVYALATGMLDGRPIVVSGSADNTVRVWDLATGAPIGQPLVGHAGSVRAVATTMLDGRPIVVSASGEFAAPSTDTTVRAWDLATGAELGAPFTGHADGIFAVATAMLDGQPVVVSGGLDDTIRTWDLAARAAS